MDRADSLFPMKPISNNREHGFNIKGETLNTCGRFFFKIESGRAENTLLGELVEASMTVTFKRHLDRREQTELKNIDQV